LELLEYGNDVRSFQRGEEIPEVDPQQVIIGCMKGCILPDRAAASICGCRQMDGQMYQYSVNKPTLNKLQLACGMVNQTLAA
jgi:hypothetical protein